MSAFNAISLLFIIHTTRPTPPSLSTSTPQWPDCHLLIAAADRIAEVLIATTSNGQPMSLSPFAKVPFGGIVCKVIFPLLLIQDAPAIKMSERTYCKAYAATVARPN